MTQQLTHQVQPSKSPVPDDGVPTGWRGTLPFDEETGKIGILFEMSGRAVCVAIRRVEAYAVIMTLSDRLGRPVPEPDRLIRFLKNDIGLNEDEIADLAGRLGEAFVPGISGFIRN